MSEDGVAGVGDYKGAAAGWGALKAVADAVRGQMAIVKVLGSVEVGYRVRSQDLCQGGAGHHQLRHGDHPASARYG